MAPGNSRSCLPPSSELLAGASEQALDAQKPGPQRGRAAETVQVLPRSNEDFLNEILDEIEPRRQPLADECVDGIRVRIYEFRCGLAIPLQDGSYQCNIVVDGTSVLSGWQRNAARLASTHCLDAPDGIKYSFRPGTGGSYADLQIRLLS